MSPRIELFGADTINYLHWPANEEAQYAKKYLIPLIKDGPLSNIDNADVQMVALTLDALVIPLVISEERPDNSDVCSPYSHYVKYTLEEMAKRHGRVPLWLLKPLLLSMAVAVRAGHLDKVVYVNNWLFTTNPCLELSCSQIGEITTYLKQRYPDYAIIFRSVNRYTHKHFSDALRENKYKMVASRKVYILDPCSRAYAKNTNISRDCKLLENTPYDIIESDEFTDSDITRITKLYRDLYLRKHSLLNPQFNERFFSLTLKENIFTFKALKKNGQIDSFVAYYSKGGVMTGAVLGYDIDLPIELGLYRQAFAMLITAASEKGQLLNMSAGAGSFKVYRGASPCIEFDAIQDHHLPYHRRLAWYCLMAGGIFQRLNVANVAKWRWR
ncbi:MAG: GNAT family N-acetyltransferase [Thermodesulfobacteriota bacterium]